MNAHDIKRILIKSKGESNICVPECKTGRTFYVEKGNSPKLLDLWTMSRSWKNPNYTGFEIKTSRGDFTQDKRRKKWESYLKYCNKFYFVCPPGIIKPKDLPPGIGLIWISKDGKGLSYKAPSENWPVNERDIDDLKQYILMYRTEIVDSRYNK